MTKRLLAAFWVLVSTFGIGAFAKADEIGPNDFRISHMGPDGSTGYGASEPAVAYNSAADEFFVVWIGTDDVDTVTNGAPQIFGQRIDAKTGAILGSRHRLSDIGDNDSANPTSSSFNDPPDVAYDSQNNQYLVVWAGSDVGRTFGGAPLAVGEREVFGQRVDATTGAETGANDFRISVMGTDGTTTASGLRPSVAYNSTNNEYLVVWMGFDTAFSGKQGDLFGQRINASNGSFIGSQALLRVPDTFNEVPGNFLEPDRTDVAYNPVDNEYFAVFRCDCFGEGGVHPGPGREIFGQRLDGNAVGIGVERLLSDMGSDADPTFIDDIHSIAFNSRDDEYLVVWQGTDTSPTEAEIYGQRVSASGDETGTNDLRISFMGPDGNSNFGGFFPALAYNSANDEYFVVWYGDTDQGGQVDEDIEAFGQRVAAGPNASGGGDLIGTNARLSDMMGLGTPAYAVQNPNVAYNPADNISLVVWNGVDDVAPSEGEIYGQLETDPKCGNGVTEASEVCDDGNADNTDACLNTCVAASCGDGFVHAGVETCDDGNADNTDSCLNTCVPASCGAAFVRTGIEACDDGNTDDADNCKNDCSGPGNAGGGGGGGGGAGGTAVCGDGTVDSGEACDDGNTLSGDGCSATCAVETEHDLTCANPNVDFLNLTEGRTVSIAAPDSSCGGPAPLILNMQNLPSNCVCAWTINPAVRGSIGNARACNTTLTPGPAGTGQLSVDVDCGGATETFLQSLVVNARPASSSGGCSLVR